MRNSYLKSEVTSLIVGNLVFFKGKQWRIATATRDEVGLIPLNIPFNTVMIVARANVEPLAENLYKIGDPVASQHTFAGVVTGFEVETNRVVCMSNKIKEYEDRVEPGSGDRTRFAYALKDIRPNNTVKINIGGRYKVRAAGQACACMYRAVQHPIHERFVVLIPENTFDKQYINVFKETTREELAEDFKHFEEMSA